MPPTRENRMYYQIIILVSLTTLLRAQKTTESEINLLGLYYNETNIGMSYNNGIEIEGVSLGYSLFELKKSSIVIHWTSYELDYPSELGTWSLHGDTVKLKFQTDNWVFIWDKGDLPDKEPYFYSSPWTYKKVGRNEIAHKSFVKYFVIEGKAVSRNGIPMLHWNQSTTTFIEMDNLLEWDEKYLNKNITIHGMLVDGKYEYLMLKDWNVIHSK